MNTKPNLLKSLPIPRIAALTVAGALSACASHPIPELQLAASHDAIEAATARVGPDAADDLARAHTKMALARHLAADGQGEPSRWLAEQAQVDAELAQARASSAQAAREARRWQASLRLARESLATTQLVRESRR